MPRTASGTHISPNSGPDSWALSVAALLPPPPPSCAQGVGAAELAAGTPGFSPGKWGAGGAQGLKPGRLGSLPSFAAARGGRGAGASSLLPQFPRAGAGQPGGRGEVPGGIVPCMPPPGQKRRG